MIPVNLHLEVNTIATKENNIKSNSLVCVGGTLTSSLSTQAKLWSFNISWMSSLSYIEKGACITAQVLHAPLTAGLSICDAFSVRLSRQRLCTTVIVNWLTFLFKSSQNSLCHHLAPLHNRSGAAGSKQR